MLLTYDTKIKMVAELYKPKDEGLLFIGKMFRAAVILVIEQL